MEPYSHGEPALTERVIHQNVVDFANYHAETNGFKRLSGEILHSYEGNLLILTMSNGRVVEFENSPSIPNPKPGQYAGFKVTPQKPGSHDGTLKVADAFLATDGKTRQYLTLGAVLDATKLTVLETMLQGDLVTIVPVERKVSRLVKAAINKVGIKESSSKAEDSLSAKAKSTGALVMRALGYANPYVWPFSYQPPRE